MAKDLSPHYSREPTFSERLTIEDLRAVEAPPSVIEQLFGGQAEGAIMEEEENVNLADPGAQNLQPVVPDVMVGVPKEEIDPIIDMFEERID
jgi:hypothetical protein